MKCPVCNIKIRCVDGRNVSDGFARQRRYKCSRCGTMVYTLEEVMGTKERRKDENNS